MTTSLKGRISGPSVFGGPPMPVPPASWERGRLARFFGKERAGGMPALPGGKGKAGSELGSLAA